MTELRPRQNGVHPSTQSRRAPFFFSMAVILFAANLPLIASSAIAAENPIEIESRSVTGQVSNPVAGVTEMLPYQQPIEEEGPSGIEGQYQLQLMQQDVMELRGLVEELSHELDRMRTIAEDRYLELDRRFQSLSQGMANAPAAQLTLNGDVPPAVGSGAGKIPAQGEKRLYETALELIRNKQYELAISQLLVVIEQYPDGTYAPNAYYWLGEVYAAKPDPQYEEARQALAQVITFFPDHRKVPDAAFKLGKVYNLMGDCERASDILNQVIEQQKGKSVAKLAETYLNDRVKCEQE